MTTATPYYERFAVQGATTAGTLLLTISTLDMPGGIAYVGARPGGIAISREVSGGGPAAPLGPFASTTCVLSLFGAGLDVLAGRGDDYARVDLYRLDGQLNREWHEFSGFIEPEAFVDFPGLGTGDVRFVAADGVGMALGSRFVVDPADPGYDGDDDTTALETLRSALAELATADGVAGRLVSRVGLAANGASGDPLAALSARARAWVDDDGAALFQDAALRQWSARLGCRVFQTRGRVSEGGVRYVVQQRSLLAADASAVVTRTYDLASGTLLSTTTDDLLFDATGLTWGPEAERARLLPVASVDVVRDFGEDLDDLVANGSFEAGSGESADHWSLSGASGSAPVGPSYCRRVAVPSEGIDGTGGLEPTFGDTHALQFTDDGGLGFARPVAAQGGYAVVPREDGSAVEIDGRMHFTPGAGPAFTAAHQTAPARLRIEVATPSGVVSVQRRTLEVRSDTLQGTDVRLPVQAVLGSFGGAVAGTPVALAGASFRLAFEEDGEVASARFTLTRDLVVGATSASGDLDADVPAGAEAPLYFFAPGQDGITLHDAVGLLTGSREFSITGTPPAIACDGTPVEGGLIEWFEGAKINAGASEASRSRETWHVGSILVGPRAGEDGQRAPVNGQVDRVGLPGRGLAVQLPTSDGGLRIGDGPLPDDDGALLVNGLPTAQGDSTAWANAAEPGVTSSSIGEAVARDGLRQLAGVDGSGAESLLRQWSGEVHLGSLVYDAAQALRLTHAGGTPANYWWDRMTWSVIENRLRLEPATELRLADVTGALHEIELLS